jgi:hypothetical protein
MLELEEIRGGIAHDKRLVHFNSALESKTDVGEKRHIALLAELVELVKVSLLAKRHAEVAGVHGQLTHGHSLGRGPAQVTDQLVPEKVERYAVVVATSQLAPQLGDVELDGLVEVVGRDSEVKNVTTFSHD